MTTSRLDRLVVLLETGSTQLIRTTAAQQLADVQKNHPDELFNLLARIVPYLRSSSWDTRTAAAKAIGGILEHAERFDPNATLDSDEDAKSEVKADVKKEEDHVENGHGAVASASPLLKLATLDVESILTHGKELLGSAGKRYDFKLAGLNPLERLEHHRRTLPGRLGLLGEYVEEEDPEDYAQVLPGQALSLRTGTSPGGGPGGPSHSNGTTSRQMSPDDSVPPTPAGGR